MDRPKIQNYKKGPERVIQDAIMDMLRMKGWYVLETFGNMYQYGFPDLYATHSQYGIRWIEVKNPKAYSFTPAQLEVFPKLNANGTGIWILVAANETEYRKLWEPANWYIYLLMKRTRGGGINVRVEETQIITETPTEEIIQTTTKITTASDLYSDDRTL